MSSNGRFCHAKPMVWADSLNTRGMKEASALVTSSNGKYFYVVNDSPGGNPYVFAIDRSQPERRVTIVITGIKMSGFNPTRGEGYGDWEALAVGTHPNDPSKSCIIVGDIGHNKARGSAGKLRKKDQQTRLIYVEEPAAHELAEVSTLSVKGTEYYFQYGKNNTKFDAEAMAVVGNTVYIITKNKRTGNTKSYVYAAANDSLRADQVNTFQHAGEMQVHVSEVTDAFATQDMLALRTYQSINFYRLQDLRPGKSAHMMGFQKLTELRMQGQQEAMAYDTHQRTIYLCGEGSRKIFSLKFDAEAAYAKWNRPGARVMRSTKWCCPGVDRLFKRVGLE